MSEHEPQNHEKFEHKTSSENSPERQTIKHEHEPTKSEKEHGNEKHVENLSKHVEQQAISGKEVSGAENEQPKNHPVLVNKQLKDMAFSRSLTRARKKLSAPGKAFSKIAHNNTVDRASETLGKTVARPSGMLWGAVFAFIGTSALLWITRHYGYEYNYLVAILMFAIGMTVGLAGEGLWRLVKKK